jgi:hypothetical protein
MSRGTFRVNDFTGWSKALTVTADGGAVISHAGGPALRLTADRRGLTAALSSLARNSRFCIVKARLSQDSLRGSQEFLPRVPNGRRTFVSIMGFMNYAPPPVAGTSP